MVKSYEITAARRTIRAFSPMTPQRSRDEMAVKPIEGATLPV